MNLIFKFQKQRNFLKDYLENPDRFNAICDDTVMNYYYDNKPSMKGELTNEDYVNLSYYFLDYKANLKEDLVVKPLLKLKKKNSF